jgi:hypothetical protein
MLKKRVYAAEFKTAQFNVTRALENLVINGIKLQKYIPYDFKFVYSEFYVA